MYTYIHICRGDQEEGETKGGRSASPKNSGRESKAQCLRWSLRVREQETREDIEGNVFHGFKKNHAESISLIVSHPRTCGHKSWRWTNFSMLSHVRRERFLVITLPAVENKRSGAAEAAGIASIRLAKTPNQGKRVQHRDATRRQDSCPWERPGDSASLPYLDLPVSDLCA